MNYRTAMPNRQNNAAKYLVNEILEASPQKLILKVYDFAITNCQNGELVKTNNAIGELINALSFDTEEKRKISLELLKLYQFAQDQMRKGETDIVLNILVGLRDTWLQVFENQPEN